MDTARTKTWQIRVCTNASCGLRYPFSSASPFGKRCPVCLGRTKTARKISSWAENTSKESDSESIFHAVLLDNVRSALNVGSIFRTADGFGISNLFLCGITPTPENDSIKKTALGAEKSINWTYSRNAVKLAKILKKEGFTFWALETIPGAKSILSAGRQPIRRPQTFKGRVLIVGNEEAGVDPDLLDLCSEVFYLPMKGYKRSYNVAVSFGIAAGMLTLLVENVS